MKAIVASREQIVQAFTVWLNSYENTAIQPHADKRDYAEQAADIIITNIKRQQALNKLSALNAAVNKTDAEI